MILDNVTFLVIMICKNGVVFSTNIIKIVVYQIKTKRIRSQLLVGMGYLRVNPFFAL